MSEMVCLTAALGYRYPEIFGAIKINLEAAGVEVKVIHRCENIWARDFMPCSVGAKLFRFQYDKNGKYPQLDVSNEPWTGVFNKPIYISPIILDGGNLVCEYGKAILTEKVIQDNGDGVVVQLEKLLGCEIIIIPVEPGDDLGHSDGIVKFIDADNVLVNDYSGTAKRDKRFYPYKDKLERALCDHGLKTHPIVNAYDQWDWHMSEKQFRKMFPDADGWNPAIGYYLNYLEVKDTILLPAFRFPQDFEAMQTIKRIFPNSNVVCIDCSRLAWEGGCVHCVTSGPYLVSITPD